MKLNRRSLLGMLGVAPLVPLASSLIESKPEMPTPSPTGEDYAVGYNDQMDAGSAMYFTAGAEPIMISFSVYPYVTTKSR